MSWSVRNIRGHLDTHGGDGIADAEARGNRTVDIQIAYEISV